MYRLYFVIICFLCFLTACSPSQPSTVKFSLYYQGEALPCKSPLFRRTLFYVSQFESQIPLTMVAGSYNNQEVALLGADCREPSAWQVKLEQPLVYGETLKFSLGVPFTLNHDNPLTAPSPLNVSEMFWSWQLGHKFLRLDSDSDFAFHLGSTGCKSDSKLRAPSKPCDKPNRFDFILESFDPDQVIIFDLSRLLEGVSMTTSCMSEQDNLNCQKLFYNLKHNAVFYQEK